MRLKFVSIVLLLVGLVGGGVWLLKKPTSVPTAGGPAPAVAVASKPSAPAPVPAIITKKTMTPEEHAAAIDAEKDRLLDWGMKSDGQSYSNILGDLVSPDKEIRMAAIEAVKGFGDTNAIPVLKSLVPNAADNAEAIALLEAADFLSISPLSINDGSPAPKTTPEEKQALAQRKARIEARHHIADPSLDGNRNPQIQQNTQPMGQ